MTAFVVTALAGVSFAGQPRWTTLPLPRTSAYAPYGGLNAVACSSMRDCWVGGAAGGGTTEVPRSAHGLLAHFNGRSWTNVTLPAASTVNLNINAVTCNSGTSCTAVGSVINSAGGYDGAALIWNGHEWRNIATTPIANASFLGVACLNSSTCAIVGLRQTASDGSTRAGLWMWQAGHWHGVTLPTALTRPNSVLETVSCPSPTLCLAGGLAISKSGAGTASVLRWDGTSWSPVVIPKAPKTQQPFILGISCSTAAFCLAVGGDGPGQPLVIRWNGTHWVNVPLPAGFASGYVALSSVSCFSPMSCVVISQGDPPQFARWNGRNLSGVRTVPLGKIAGQPGAGQLSAVSCPTAQGCLAAGYRWVPDSPGYVVSAPYVAAYQ